MPLQTIRIYYRTKDGLTDYHFSFEQQNNHNWRIYILNQPPYGNRRTSDHATHRHKDGSRYYICWTKPIRSFEDAKDIASAWADNTQTYIRNGTRF